MAQQDTAVRTLGIDGLPDSARTWRLTLAADLDEEAGAFVQVLMREHGLTDYRTASELVIEAGLKALGL